MYFPPRRPQKATLKWIHCSVVHQFVPVITPEVRNAPIAIFRFNFPNTFPLCFVKRSLIGKVENFALPIRLGSFLGQEHWPDGRRAGSQVTRWALSV